MTTGPKQTDVARQWTVQHADAAVHLCRVTDADKAVRRAQAELREVIEAARRTGCTWEAIAAALDTACHATAPDDIPSIDDIVSTALRTKGPIQPASTHCTTSGAVSANSR